MWQAVTTRHIGFPPWCKRRKPCTYVHLNPKSSQKVQSFGGSLTKSLTSVEVERVAVAQLTIDQLPRLVKPTFGCIIPALKNDMVALQALGKIVPSSCDEVVFSLQVLDDLVCGGLLSVSKVSPCNVGKKFTYSLRDSCFSVFNSLELASKV